MKYTFFRDEKYAISIKIIAEVIKKLCIMVTLHVKSGDIAPFMKIELRVFSHCLPC